MRIVLDASAIVALITREPESDSVALKFAAWAEDGAELHAPDSHAPTALERSSVRWTLRRNAFDAAYVALATRIGTELWTIDGPLARNAGGRGHPVRLISGTS